VLEALMHKYKKSFKRTSMKAIRRSGTRSWKGHRPVLSPTASDGMRHLDASRAAPARQVTKADEAASGAARMTATQTIQFTNGATVRRGRLSQRDDRLQELWYPVCKARRSATSRWR
jgi:hypothetical protein